MRDVSAILNIIREGTLDDDAPYEYTENLRRCIPTTLMKHQLQSIHAMSVLENKVNTNNAPEYVVSEMGVLANKVGSGKSLCILGLITNQPMLDSNDVVKECHGDLFVMENRTTIDKIVKAANLIVVPQHLQRSVWIPYLKSIKLPHVVVTKDNVHDNSIGDFTVVLCCAKYYNVLMKNCGWVWSRVVFDEADTIPIPACVKPNTNFVWFITSSIHNLIFYQGYYWNYVDGTMTRTTTRGIANQGYIKNTFRNLKECSLLQNVIIKFNDGYLQHRLDLPPLFNEYHQCKSPYYFRVVHDLVSTQVLSHIHGNDLDGAMEQLGCCVDNTTNIIASILTNLKDRILKHELKRDYLLQLKQSISNTTNKDVDTKISKNEACISHWNEQMEKIHTRVMGVAHTDIRHACPICMEKTTTNTTCIFACCLNLFCTDCVKKVIQHNITCCPLCRTEIEYSNIFKLANEENRGKLGCDDSQKTCGKLDKNTTLLKLIVSIHNEFSEYSIVIFAMYEESILSIQSALYNSLISFRTLRGNNIHNTLQWFDNTKCGVMIVNAQLHGSGLNLNKTTHVLMYQQFTPDLTMQLVGRAHRIGKTTPLYVHTLNY